MPIDPALTFFLGFMGLVGRMSRPSAALADAVSAVERNEIAALLNRHRWLAPKKPQLCIRYGAVFFALRNPNEAK
jgi:hypothetical protein